MRKWIILWVCFCNHALFAQSNEAEMIVAGIVIHKETGKPLENTHVELTRDELDTLRKLTNDTGYFVFELDTLLPFNLTVSKDGFNPYSEKYQSENSPGSSLNFYYLFELTEINLGCALPPSIYFREDSDVIMDSCLSDLNLYLEVLNKNPSLVVQFIGLVDYKEEINLSMARAKAVRLWLVDKGINEDRLLLKPQEHITQNGIEAPQQLIDSIEASINSGNSRACYFEIISDDFEE